jgi:hypothetical protein
VITVIVRRSVRPARYSQLGHERTMTLDHAALVQVLEAMKAADVDDRIKLAAQTIYQGLIDAELTSVIGAGPWRTPRPGQGCVTGPGRGCCPPRRAIWSWRSRSCGRARSFPRCWNAAAG